jgi:hypothetical protein
MDEHAALYLDLDLYPIFTSKLANAGIQSKAVQKSWKPDFYPYNAILFYNPKN